MTKSTKKTNFGKKASSGEKPSSGKKSNYGEKPSSGKKSVKEKVASKSVKTSKNSEVAKTTKVNKPNKPNKPKTLFFEDTEELVTVPKKKAEKFVHRYGVWLLVYGIFNMVIDAFLAVLASQILLLFSLNPYPTYGNILGGVILVLSIPYFAFSCYLVERAILILRHKLDYARMRQSTTVILSLLTVQILIEIVLAALLSGLGLVILVVLIPFVLVLISLVAKIALAIPTMIYKRDYQASFAKKK